MIFTQAIVQEDVREDQAQWLMMISTSNKYIDMAAIIAVYCLAS